MFKPKAERWEQPKSNFTFSLAQRPYETLRCSGLSEVLLVERVCVVLSSDQQEDATLL